LTTNTINFAEITGFLNPDRVPEPLDEIEYLHVGNVKIADCACGRCVRARIRAGIPAPVVAINPEDTEDAAGPFDAFFYRVLNDETDE